MNDLVQARAVGEAIARRTEESLRVAEIVDRTYTIPRKDGVLVRPDGMSDAEWNLHQDAMMSGRNVPVYLSEHLRRVETAQKIAGAQGGQLPLIAGFIVHTVHAKVYDVIDVTVNEEK